MAVEELAAACGLSAGTVVHHLKRLEAAGLVESTPRRPYVEYALRVDRLQAISKQLAGLERAGEAGVVLPGPEGQALPAYDAKVLRAFLRDGHLVSIPAQERKRRAILRYLASRCFAEDRGYPEREVNERLSPFHEDVAALRRYMVVAGLMTRSGGVYRRVAASPAGAPGAGDPSEREPGKPNEPGKPSERSDPGNPTAPARTATIVVMGVSGCGKSTVMAALADRLGWATAEADDFHSAANVARMRSGHPLTDEDRRPWLEALAAWIGERERAGESAIVTCSALKRAYRDLLGRGHPSVWFAHLVVEEAVIADRLDHRQGHYMPATLLASQLDTLEPLRPDEPGAAIAANRPPQEIAADILARLRASRP